MTNSEDMMKDLDSREVVRLKIDGASSTVNTLGDHKTARGVSLVCPFPALEVDVPVSFGSSDSKDMHQGFIHRIGVEDDPETGLPRLRLSIRTRNTRSTVVAEMPQKLLDESSRLTVLPDSHAATSLDIASSDEIMPLISDEDSGEIDPLLDELLGEEDSWGDITPSSGDDPAWVDCSDLPLPEEFIECSKTRRRYRLARHAAWAGVLALVMAGGFMLDRTKVVDFDKVRAAVSGFSLESMKIDSRGMIIGDKVLDETALAKTDAPAQLIPELPIAKPVLEEVISRETEQMGFSSEEKIVAASPQIVPVTAIEENLEEEAPQPFPQQIEVATTPSAKAALSIDPNEVTLTLPTRWPVDYATGYRVRNPNGIVIDVPGGLVKREGWLESVAKDHPMVRSIKAVQRESGARYIVFVNGDLPRFMTTSKTGGVSLRLFYNEEDAVPTQVATLD